jgi:excisionase family DNA binding protein
MTLLRVGEAARRLGVSTGCVHNWVRRGYLRGVRLAGPQLKIPESDVSRLLERAGIVEERQPR